jgi:hypothetical protein
VGCCASQTPAVPVAPAAFPTRPPFRCGVRGCPHAPGDAAASRREETRPREAAPCLPEKGPVVRQVRPGGGAGPCGAPLARKAAPAARSAGGAGLRPQACYRLGRAVAGGVVGPPRRVPGPPSVGSLSSGVWYAACRALARSYLTPSVGCRWGCGGSAPQSPRPADRRFAVARRGLAPEVPWVCPQGLPSSRPGRWRYVPCARPQGLPSPGPGLVPDAALARPQALPSSDVAGGRRTPAPAATAP